MSSKTANPVMHSARMAYFLLWATLWHLLLELCWFLRCFIAS